MACSRSPPASPRAPKIQQQSWDDSDTPPIDLYDPNHQSPPRSPGRMTYYDHPLNSPNARKYDKLRDKQQICKSPSSPRRFDFPELRNPQIDFDYAVDQQQYGTPPKVPPTIHCTYQKSPTNSGVYYDRKNTPQSIITSPRGSQSLEYGAISPKYEHKHKKFEYYEPCSPEDERNDDDEDDNSFIEYRHSSIQYKKKKKKHYNKSPNGVFSLDEYHSNSDKRGSLVTESTGSGASDFSTATTARCSSGNEPEQQQQQQPQQQQQQHHRRRHAINITTNPGYQAIHNSHSTLDRTCSDSVVSSRIRKSTSDLTQATEVQSPVQPTHRRRGSSKGGLAYLASRRNSRESIKSAASNASIFSNDDIGPLAFQASARGQQRRTSNFLELPIPDHARPRVCSLPERPYNPRQSDDLYRLRTFSISKGTVVNCGDSIISRRSRSNTSVNSTTSRASERSPFEGSCCGGGYATVDSMPNSPTDSDPPPPPRYRVVMLGDSGCGKTALVSQFMTSEYMHTYDASLDSDDDFNKKLDEEETSRRPKKTNDEFGEKTVSILLDGEESEMIFIDHPTVEMSVENSLSTYEPHACVIVYSVVQRSSFHVAEEILNYLWRENISKEKAVILVGNKADLARSRVISTADGKQLAQSRDAKFIETSSGIQHNVDELLVGVLKQIRLKETREKKAQQSASKMRNSKTHLSLHLAKEILQKIGLTDISKSKSCENLHVL